jgi:hypothetical protein
MNCEMDAIVELASILSIIRDRTEISLNVQGPWTADLGDQGALVIIDGGNNIHYLTLYHDYIKSYESENFMSECRNRTILIVAQRSTGRADPILQPIELDITVPTARIGLEDESPFKHTRNKSYICKDDFFQQIRVDTSGTNLLNTELEKILA